MRRASLLTTLSFIQIMVVGCDNNLNDHAQAHIDQVASVSQRSDIPWVFSGPTMGTHYSVKLYPPKKLQLQRSETTDKVRADSRSSLPPPTASVQAQVQRDIDALLERVNMLMSTYQPDSEISKFNASPVQQRFELALETYKVLELAGRVHLRSEGYFDVTVGPLVEAWGFGAQGRRETPPSELAINSALNRVGQSALSLEVLDVETKGDIDQLDAKMQQFYGVDLLEAETSGMGNQQYFLLKNKSVHVDLSAIAKGYAVDLVANYLRAIGGEDFLVEVGGEVSTSGRKRDGESWRIALEVPQPGQRSVQRILNLSNVAVATSGNYRNFFEYKGKRYAHSIDPNTGWPVVHGLASVTVLVPALNLTHEGDAIDAQIQTLEAARVHWKSGAAEADAWATALLVAGPEHAVRLAQQYDLAAIFIFQTQDGRYTERVTASAKRYVLEK